MLSKLSVPADNYSFCTIDPNEARVPVPDPRFDHLCEFWKPPSMIAATLTIYDIAGLVAGAAEGKGLGNAFLSHIAEVDGIYHVIRAFSDKEIEHFEGSVDPVRDLATISNELRLKDLERATNECAALEKVVQRGMDKSKGPVLETMKKAKELLEKGTDIRYGDWNLKEVDVINPMNFLSAKPVVYLVNISLKDYAKQKSKSLKSIKDWVEANSPGSPVIPFSATYEKALEAGEVKESEEAPLQKSVLPKIIHAGYKCLRLIYFFTVGDDEVRCWTIQKGTKAKPASAVIHTDFEKGFQSADVYSYDDFKRLGNPDEVKKEGKLRTQGKDYVVLDGDIIHFKINQAAAAASKKKK